MTKKIIFSILFIFSIFTVKAQDVIQQYNNPFVGYYKMNIVNAFKLPISFTKTVPVSSLLPGYTFILNDTVTTTNTAMYASLGNSNARITRMIDSFFLYGTFLPSLTTQYWKQGGNSFGAPGRLGTIDNNVLFLMQFNTNRLALSNNALYNATNNLYMTFRYGSATEGAFIYRGTPDAFQVFGTQSTDTTSTGDLFNSFRGSTKVYRVDYLGALTAKGYSLTGGTANQILLGNGTTAVYLTTTSNIDFGNVLANAETAAPSTVTITGAVVGDFVNVQAASNTVGIMYKAFITAPNTGTVYAVNNTTAPIDPASLSFKFTIIR